MTASQTAYGSAITVQIVPLWCSGCRIPYGLPEGFLDQRREDHQSWTCPNGCVRLFRAGSSQAEKRAAEAERELEAARSLAQRESRRRESAQQAARAADYRARAAKGALTRARKRMAAGVCPCCNRTVSQLAAHMATQHPDFPGGDS